MKKYLVILTALLSIGLVDCRTYTTAPQPEPTTSATISPIPSSTPTVTPSPTSTPGVHNVTFISSNAYPSQLEALADAETKMNNTIASKCFGDFMLNRELVQTEIQVGGPALTRQQVVDRIRSLKGKISTVFYTSAWYEWNAPVGYTYPTDPNIYLNTKKMGVSCDMASLIGHEGVGHKLGNWDHDYNNTARRPFSVPYSINAAFTECCK